MTERVIIDTDPGIDDALALLSKPRPGDLDQTYKQVKELYEFIDEIPDIENMEILIQSP